MERLPRLGSISSTHWRKAQWAGTQSFAQKIPFSFINQFWAKLRQLVRQLYDISELNFCA